MSNDFSNPLDAQPSHVEKTSVITQPVQIALRLRPVDHSDRAIVANVSAARLSSSMVFLDFGLIEQPALDSSVNLQ